MIQVDKKADNLKDGITNMMLGAKNDYIRMSTSGGKELTGYSKEQVDNWDSKTKIKEGKKYIKVINQNAVKCFIVNTTEDKVFDYGDILKPAGWNAPARNYKRGNVLEGNYLMQWTGPMYMS